MPRPARPVFPAVPHHITQRGNRRENVFFTDSDRAAYLKWLEHYCAKYKVDVLAYCLMTNHVHLVASPQSDDALEKVFRPLHTRYAQRINRARQWSGHLWQGRYFSSPLDDTYLWTAIRYVERNPVRAGIAVRAEDYRWSSAPAHCNLTDDYVLTRDTRWLDQLGSVGDWSQWLAEPDEKEKMQVLRRHAERSLPCGADDFIQGLELLTGQIPYVAGASEEKRAEAYSMKKVCVPVTRVTRYAAVRSSRRAT
jgi:putative transposase